MKKIYRIVSYLLVAVLLISMGGVHIVADEVNAEEQILSNYFAQRELFLKFEQENIPAAVIPITEDEMEHREALCHAGVTVRGSSIMITEIGGGENFYTAIVHETLTYELDGTMQTEIVVHEVEIMKETTGDLIVIGDGYVEDVSGFISCSYVEPDSLIQTFSQNAITEPSFCITVIAEGEVGYKETGYNVTKYGEWFGLQDQWCVMFIAWCANQANISTSIIPKEKTTTAMRNFFSPLGRYYSTSSTTTTPQVGDIYFKGSSSTSTTHVGIIVKVDSTYIYTVEGNAGANTDSVVTDKHRLDASYFVAFARPAYTKTHVGSWSITNTTHSGTCRTCGEYVCEYHHYVQSGSTQTCRECGYSITLNRSADEIYLQ